MSNHPFFVAAPRGAAKGPPGRIRRHVERIRSSRAKEAGSIRIPPSRAF